MAIAKLPYRILSIFSLLLILGAFVFWIAWGVNYDGWNLFDKDFIGVYAIFIVMFFFGLFGFLLLRKQNQAQQAKK